MASALATAQPKKIRSDPFIHILKVADVTLNYDWLNSTEERYYWLI